MTDAQKADAPAKPDPKPDPHANTAGKPLIHRVCIQCNNMFLVTADRYDAKQCSNCHKG